MNTINSIPRFLMYALSQALKHPRQPVTYLYCPECNVRLKSNAGECPVCGHKAGNSPQLKQMSPIPWWGSVLVIVIGAACWCVGGHLGIVGLDEAGRALVYIPLGSLFGMSVPR